MTQNDPNRERSMVAKVETSTTAWLEALWHRQVVSPALLLSSVLITPGVGWPIFLCFIYKLNGWFAVVGQAVKSL